MILAGIRAVTTFLSVPFFLKKGRRQAFLGQESSQRTNTDDICWSSSENEDNSNNAFNVNFNNANVNNGNKDNACWVRAVCAFSMDSKAVTYSYPGDSKDIQVCRIRTGLKSVFAPCVSDCFHSDGYKKSYECNNFKFLF